MAQLPDPLVRSPDSSAPVFDLTLLPDPELYVPFLAPNSTAVGAGGGPVFLGQGVNTSLTPATAPPPVNLTALGEEVPSEVSTTAPPGPAAPSTSSNSSGGSGGSGGGSNAAVSVSPFNAAVSVAMGGAVAAIALML